MVDNVLRHSPNFDASVSDFDFDEALKSDVGQVKEKKSKHFKDPNLSKLYDLM
jgi:hypothetical protein